MIPTEPFLHRVWDTLVRWRTWIVNAGFAILLIAPDILQSREILALVPPKLAPWLIAAAFLINIWMRPRAAVRAKDVK